MKIVKQSSYLVLSLTAALLSGCGSNGVTGDPGATFAQDGGEIYTPPVVTSTTGYGAYPLSFKTVGSDPNGGPSSPVVSAPLRSDTKLVIKATVGAATRNEGTPVYTNFTANYSCATLRVTLQMQMNGSYVDFASVDTGRISVPGTSGCAGSVASENIDFSAYLTPGHGLFKIKVAALTSNFNCVTALQYPYRYPYGYAQTVCAANPMQSIYQYHVVNGKLEVQVNGTSFVN